MIIRVDYENTDYFIEIELLKTPAVDKWLFAFIHNHRLFKYNPYIRHLCCYPENSIHYSSAQISKKKSIVTYINKAIESTNALIKGRKFPLLAKEEMDFEYTQKIHRAFTVSQVTGNAWEHNLSYDQLYDLKFLTPLEKADRMKELVKPEFEVLDPYKFTVEAEKINQGVHKYEPFIKSERAIELQKANHDDVMMFHQFDSIASDGLNSSEIVQMTLTEEDLQKSFPGNYLDYNVYIHSHIFGKSYIETYVEYDPAIEFDVTNVENIIGDFQWAWYNRVGKKSYFHKSKWLHWVRDTLLPDYLTHPVPLGRTVGWRLPDTPSELTEYKGIPSIIWRQ